MAEFIGTFDLAFHETKNMLHLKASENGKLKARNSKEIAAATLATMIDLKCGIDRWSFYFEGLSQELKDGDMQDKHIIGFKTAKKLFETAQDWEVTVDKARYGKPRLTFHNPDATKVTKGKPKVNKVLSVSDILANLS